MPSDHRWRPAVPAAGLVSTGCRSVLNAAVSWVGTRSTEPRACGARCTPTMTAPTTITLNADPTDAATRYANDRCVVVARASGPVVRAVSGMAVPAPWRPESKSGGGA